MIAEIQKLVTEYTLWLKDKTKLRQLKDWIEITTPYLDRHNDYLQIYVRKHERGYLLTDDRYTLDDLESSGCNLNSPKRQMLLKTILNGYGVQLHEGALEVITSANDFPHRKHNLVQAMLAVNDLFNIAKPIVSNLFYEDVTNWLDLNKIRFVSHFKFTGKSGFDHTFDFVIPKSGSEPERILQTINHPNRNLTQALSFAWLDTKEVRPQGSKAYAIINDTDHPVSENLLDALKNYEIEPTVWSQRDTIVKKLAA